MVSPYNEWCIGKFPGLCTVFFKNSTRYSEFDSFGSLTVPGKPLGFPLKYGCLGKTIVVEHH